MRIYDNYIILLTSLLLGTTIIFALMKETRLDLCFSVNLIVCLVVNELFIYLNPKAKKGLNKVNYLLFSGFAFIVASNIAEILWNVNPMEIAWSFIHTRLP